MTALAARRLLLPGGELVELCRRLGLAVPPGFASAASVFAGPLADGEIPPAVATGLAAACLPEVGVLVSSSIGDVAAAFGIRGDLGSSLIRARGSDVEHSVWPAAELGRELRRAVPPLPSGAADEVTMPLPELAARLRDDVIGTLSATAIAPPAVLGQVVWLATEDGWLALRPGQVRDGVRSVSVSQVGADDLGAAIAPYLAAGVR